LERCKEFPLSLTCKEDITCHVAMASISCPLGFVEEFLRKLCNNNGDSAIKVELLGMTQCVCECLVSHKFHVSNGNGNEPCPLITLTIRRKKYHYPMTQACRGYILVVQENEELHKYCWFRKLLPSTTRTSKNVVGFGVKFLVHILCDQI
jgi:hypothetical protein